MRGLSTSRLPPIRQHQRPQRVLQSEPAGHPEWVAPSVTTRRAAGRGTQPVRGNNGRSACVHKEVSRSLECSSCCFKGLVLSALAWPSENRPNRKGLRSSEALHPQSIAIEGANANPCPLKPAATKRLSVYRTLPCNGQWPHSTSVTRQPWRLRGQGLQHPIPYRTALPPLRLRSATYTVVARRN
jgi:hypothetical protein